VFPSYEYKYSTKMAKFKSFVFEERNIVLYSACVGEFKKQGIAARFTNSPISNFKKPTMKIYGSEKTQ
jgi:hypothetical protein